MKTQFIKSITEAFSIQPNSVIAFTTESEFQKKYFVSKIEEGFKQISDNERQKYYFVYNHEGDLIGEYIAKAMHVEYYYLDLDCSGNIINP